MPARITLGDDGPDPVCRELAASPLPAAEDVPGPRLLGFVACGAVVRRHAFLGAGGFREALGVGGEEELLALDLAAAGWHRVYAPNVVAVHAPSPKRSHRRRAVTVRRNDVWTTWLRRPRRVVVEEPSRSLRRVRSDVDPRAALAVVRGLGPVLRDRRPLEPDIEAQVRRLKRS